jgi:hypothetical protein
MAGFGAAPVTTGKMMLNIFDGTRSLYTDSEPLLLTIRDGNQRTVSRDFHQQSSVEFSGLTVFGNAGDHYACIASASNYKDAGFFPVKIAANTVQIVNLILLPKLSEFNFAPWTTVRTRYGRLADLLASGADNGAVAEARYNDLKEVQGGAVLACLLNITTAMSQILLPQRTALDYLKMIRWELSGPYPMAQDRFFAWADPALIEQIEQAKRDNTFEDAPGTLHPGATRSYKQVQFGEANVQLTFHENDRLRVGGTDCVMVEPDIDYYKDPLAHLLLEVAVNAFGSLTDPRAVYALRWIAGGRAGRPEFDPPYTVVKAGL